jgi:hypothetical protein
VRGVAPIVALTTMGTGGYALWSVRAAFDAASNATADVKQSLLSSRIAHAYTALAIGWGIAAVGLAVLTYATVRARRITGA